MKKKVYTILAGIILIALGVYWILRIVGVIPPEFTLLFEGWWTLFIIVPCVITLFTQQNKILSGLGIITGAALLLAAQGLISWDQLKKMVLPSLVILLGLYLLLHGVIVNRRYSATANPALLFNRLNAVFGSRMMDYTGRDFAGGSVTAVFGSAVLDLSRAMVRPEAEIRVCVVFGSVEVRLADNMSAKFHIVPFIGALGDRRAARPNKNTPAVHFGGTVTFGSVNVV